MTDRKVFRLINEQVRRNAMAELEKLPDGWRVLYEEPKRTSAQSDKMHAMLNDIRKGYKHHGQTLSTEDLKILFLDALGREMRMVPALANDGWVSLGRSTSNLSVREMSDMITLIQAFADTHGIELKERYYGLEPTLP